MDKKIEYEERYLAFVDVLGFSNLVKQSQANSAVVTQLYSALTDISARARAARSDELKLEATSFSDTVVISTPIGDAELLHLLHVIDEFGFGLLRRDMLFRGALVRGKILHRPELIFGPALIQAYGLETATSFHPRIMLDANVYAAIQNPKNGLREEQQQYIVVDAYDVPYLNPFARWQVEEKVEKAALSELMQLQDIIAAGLVAGTNSPSIGEKYKWLARKFNRFIEKRGLSADFTQINLD